MLDRTDFPHHDEQAAKLLEVLLRVYYRRDEVEGFVKTAGLEPSHIAWEGPLAAVWPRVLEHAAEKGQLRNLVSVVARSPNSAGYHIFKELLSETGDGQVAHPKGKRFWHRIKSLRMGLLVGIGFVFLFLVAAVVWLSLKPDGDGDAAGKKHADDKASADQKPSPTLRVSPSRSAEQTPEPSSGPSATTTPSATGSATATASPEDTPSPSSTFSGTPPAPLSDPSGHGYRCHQMDAGRTYEFVQENLGRRREYDGAALLR
ncbi:effector-associated domain EAD1-containing protein [Streptomyces sp. NPDC005407]|uniref:effector-associated domain EAD1-containing protein n=1 Tax=Streptomyces sp. NPDC005407 TaxID=3155340 RepID=UPI0033BEDA58